HPAQATRRDGELRRPVHRSFGATQLLPQEPAQATPGWVLRTASRCLATAALTNATATERSSRAPIPASDRGSPRASRGCPFPPPGIGTSDTAVLPRFPPNPLLHLPDASRCFRVSNESIGPFMKSNPIHDPMFLVQLSRILQPWRTTVRHIR